MIGEVTLNKATNGNSFVVKSNNKQYKKVTNIQQLM